MIRDRLQQERYERNYGKPGAGHCECCGKRLDPTKVIHLELDQRINEYHDFGGVGEPEKYSQGMFPFGPDCAKHCREEAKQAFEDSGYTPYARFHFEENTLQDQGIQYGKNMLDAVNMLGATIRYQNGWNTSSIDVYSTPGVLSSERAGFSMLDTVSRLDQGLPSIQTWHHYFVMQPGSSEAKAHAFAVSAGYIPREALEGAASGKL